MQKDVYEGDKVTLRAVETDRDVDFTVSNTDGKGKEEKKTAREYEVTFGPVPPKHDNYIISWKYKLPDGEADISGEDTYRVWPKLLHLIVKMKAGAKGKVDGFTFTLSQNGKNSTPTAPSGDWSGQIEMAAYEFSAVSPWVIETKTASDDHAAEYTLEVSQTPWTAKILTQRAGTTDTDRWKQWVNMTDKAGTAEGSLMRVEVAPNDPRLGLKDQKISVRATFPAKNSKRITPRPALVVASTPLTSKNSSAKPGVHDLVYETQLALPANGGKCEFDVQLGYAGGDQCLIEVGFDDGFGDDKLYTVNWRSLEADFVVPHSSIRQPWTDLVNNDDNAPGPDPKLEAAIKKILDPLFIKLTFPDDGRAVYAAADVEAITRDRGGAATFIFEGEMIADKLKGRKCAFLNSADLDAIRNRVLNNLALNPRRMLLIWVDQMPKTLSDDSVELEKIKPGEYYHYFTDLTPSDQEVPVPYGSGLRNPLCSGADDLWGVEKVYWSLEWRSAGDTEWSKNYWEAPDQTHMPAEDYFNVLQEVTPSSEAETKKWVEFSTCRKFKLKCPNASPQEPGHWVAGKPGLEFRALVSIALRHFKQGANANALNGKIRMTPTCGLGTPAGVARTLCHEIGHNLGHAYLLNQGEDTDNRGRQAKYKIPDIDFDPTVDDGGVFYTGKGHKGPHCASAIKKKDPKLLEADKYTSTDHIIDTNCVLFGQGDQRKSIEFTYCDDCTRYIRAGDALDVSTNWRA